MHNLDEIRPTADEFFHFLSRGNDTSLCRPPNADNPKETRNERRDPLFLWHLLVTQ